MNLINTFLVLFFIIVSTTCFAKPVDKNQQQTKTLSEIVLQMKRVDEKASKAKDKAKEMLEVLRKLIEKNKLKDKSFLHREIK